MSDKQTILVTGANTGIGYEVVKALYNSNDSYDILVGSRKLENADAAIAQLKKENDKSASSLTPLIIDISSDDSIKDALAQVTKDHGKIDALVNNAGGSFDLKAQNGEMSLRESFNAAWDVNVSGTHVLTHEAVPLLLKSSKPRLLFVTSGTSALSETERFDYPPLARLNASPEAGWPKPASGNPVISYRSSKTGLNMLMREWAKTLKNDGVKVWAISPGFLATGLGGAGSEVLKKMGARDPSEGGQFIRDVIEGKRDDDQGKVIRATMVQPW